MEKFKAHLKLKVTDENKDILDKTADEDFMFSWNGISVMFKLMLQDANKVNILNKLSSSFDQNILIHNHLQTAKLYGAAPNPLLHDPVTGDTKNLLAMVKKSGRASVQSKWWHKNTLSEIKTEKIITFDVIIMITWPIPHSAIGG